jgi:hypothetical protein
MTNSNFFIFTTLFFIFSSTHCAVQNQTNPQPCSKDQQKAYIGFYNANYKKYDLFLADLNLSKMNCFFQVFLDNGMNKTVLWVDFSNLDYTGYGNLYISHSNASELPAFEENMEIPLMSGSLNEALINEQAGKTERQDRVFSFLKPLVQDVEDSFDVSKKKSYYNTMFFLNRMNLDLLMNTLIADFFGVYLEHELPFIVQNWQEDITALMKSIGGGILTKLHQQFQNVLDDNVAKNTFKYIVEKLDSVQEQYNFILSTFDTYISEDLDYYGRNYVGSILNETFNMISQEFLVNFIKDFEITIDKKKDLDYQLVLPEEAEINSENILKYMKTIPIYKIQFFIYEKFEMIKYKRNDQNGYSFMSRAPKDNCGLTDNRKLEFLLLGQSEKALFDSLTRQTLPGIFVGCDKEVQGNSELYKMYLKPDNNEYCELMILRTDHGSDEFSSEVLLDTFPVKQSYVSCMRYCRGVIQRSMYLLI